MGSYPPKFGTAGGVHHERESFRAGWEQASDILSKKLQGISQQELDLLREWYAIRKKLTESQDKKEFDKLRIDFNSKLPDQPASQLLNGITLITGYLSNGK